MTAAAGTVYLLHFDRPYRHARHYLGFARRLDPRLEHHRNGTGARLLAVIAEHGIGFVVAGRSLARASSPERRLKNRHEHVRLCPICTPNAGRGRGNWR